jgi:hypothetical protein
MQDNPEHIGSLSQIESAKTPNWVADAGTSTWQPDSRDGLTRNSSSASRERHTADLVVNPDFFFEQQGSAESQQHAFYDDGRQNRGPQPDTPVRKPYEQVGVPPGQLDTRPLDEQIIPMGIPWQDLNDPKLDRQQVRPDNKFVPTELYEPPVKVPPAVREGNQVFIPTFSLGDGDLSSTNPVKVKSYDISSPEAQLYLKSRDSIVKITTDKVNPEGKTYNAFGSGFFVTENGQIATAHHVIDGATSIKVTTAAGHVYNARVKETNVGGEAAVIELTDMAQGERFKPLPLRDSAADIKPGDKVMAIGHPNGVEDIVMSPGAVVARERFGPTIFELPHVNPNAMFIHASTRIQGGNSGGPLIDSEGRAIGLTNFRQPVDASGEFVGIDDVRSMITDPKKGQLSDQRSFFFPSTLQWDRDVFTESAMTSLSASNVYLARATRLPHSHPGLVSSMRTAYNGAVAGYALFEMPDDYKTLKSAMQHGTSAERVSAGIDLGGDGLMLAGSLASIFSRRYAVVGNVAATLGAGSKLGNALFADRRYK